MTKQKQKKEPYGFKILYKKESEKKAEDVVDEVKEEKYEIRKPLFKSKEKISFFERLLRIIKYIGWRDKYS